MKAISKFKRVVPSSAQWLAERLLILERLRNNRSAGSANDCADDSTKEREGERVGEREMRERSL